MWTCRQPLSGLTVALRWRLVALFAVPTHLHRLFTSKRWQRCRRPVLLITDSRVSALLPLYPPIPLHSCKQWELDFLISPKAAPADTELCFYSLLWKNNTREKQGGDTHGGKDWRSELIPHVPQEENFQAGGESIKLITALSRTFHPHTATHRIHMDPFSSATPSQGTTDCFGQHQSSRHSNQQDSK